MATRNFLLAALSLAFCSLPLIVSAQNGKWSSREPIPVKTIFHSSCLMDGRIYVMGGYQYTGVEENCKIGSSVVQVYDPVSDSWDTGRKPLPEPRAKSGVAGLSGKIYLFGGTSGLPDGTSYDNILIYDIKTDTYSYSGSIMSVARLGCAACVYNGKIHVVGGLDRLFSQEFDLHEVYDPVSDTIAVAEPLPTPRGELNLVKSGSRIYAIGGCSGIRADEAPIIRAYNTIESFSDENGEWRTEDVNLPRGIYGSGIAERDGRIYLAGGLGSNYNSLFSSNVECVYIYYPAEGCIYTLSFLDLPRSISSASFYNDEIIFIGGEYYNWNCNEGLEHRFRSEVEAFRPLNDPVFIAESGIEEVENDNGEKMVRVIARFSNPSDYPLTALVECLGVEKGGIYPAYLLDDGKHSDVKEGDGLYGSDFLGPFEEDEYNIVFKAENMLLNETTTSLGMADPFTAIGPVIFTGFEFEGRDMILNPGDSLPFNLILKNTGKAATARNVSVSVLVDQPGAYHYGGRHIFGPIYPGEEKKCLFGGAIKLDKSYTRGQILNLYLSILSNGKPFWEEVIEVEVN